jgi:putative hydrolase of the HAD superfamily
MSQLAEFARELHETGARKYQRVLEPAAYPSRREKLDDIRAVIFDIYGTMINYRKPGIDDREQQPQLLMAAFREVAERFGFAGILLDMNREEKPEKTLFDLYHGLIAICREKAIKTGLVFPETKVEKIWGLILAMLKRRGYASGSGLPSSDDELARYLAYTYNFCSLGRELYPDVADGLAKLKKNNILLGIAANAQFYTPIDLSLLLRDQSKGAIDDFNELFDPDLTFFSYECPPARTGEALFRKLYDALYEYRILPQQTVFVGNDLLADIAPAQSAGMKTALYTGDRQSVYLYEQNREVLPDISFSSWNDLPDRLSFYSEGAETP